MLARKGLSKKRIFLLSGTLLVVWSIIGVVVYRNFAPPPPSPEPIVVTFPTEVVTGVIQPEEQAETIAGIGLETILRSSQLVNLKVFGEVPLEVKILGRQDPFSQINP